MSGLKNTVRRMANASVGRGYMTSGEAKRERAAKRTAVKDKMFANAVLPDPEDLKMTARRKAAGRKSARASTVMTDRETLG